jgi:uncharacterized protein CbrC (UPF0167 family)
MTEVSPSPVSGIITKGSTEIDRLKEAAFKALEYLTGTKEKGDAVRCQCCNEYRPIMGKLHRPQSNDITALEKKIRAIEQYHNISLNNNLSSNKADYVTNDIKKLKEELAQLYEEDAEYDKFRHLPLYSSACTGYKFYCSPCWDEAYKAEQQRLREERKKT